MSKSDKPIIDWSAPDYLRDFINTYLVLTFEEESILNYIYDKHRGLPVRIPKQKSERTELAEQGFKKCKMCGEILPLTQFYKHFGICKECYSIKRKRAKYERNNRD